MPDLSPRREQLMAAATRVVAEHGLRGLTHRAVDREAGLSVGSCSAYYRTRRALLDGLAEYVAAALTDDVVGLADRLRDCGPDDDRKAELTAQLILRWLTERALLLARLELALAAARDAGLAAVLGESRRRLVGVVAGIIESRGLSSSRADAEERAELLVAAIDGVLAAALLRPVRGRRQFVTASLERLMAGLAGAPATR